MQLLMAYGKSEPKEFNKVLDSYLADLDKTQPSRMRAIDLEIFFNEFKPFQWAWVAYVAIAVFAACSWLAFSSGTAMRRAAFAAMAVVFVVHTGAGILQVLHVPARPPAGDQSLLVRRLHRLGLRRHVHDRRGHLQERHRDRVRLRPRLRHAHYRALAQPRRRHHGHDASCPRRHQLQWLATHVTCITFGYTATFVAGFMGCAYILLGIFTDKRARDRTGSDLSRVTYGGVLCTGMFFSFVGTVLGGLWADYSWGRFWGWDPKENGALLIVIWVALILHARWGGMVKQRGMAVLAVLGNIVTSWSWFGTNFLGIGLHSYGFKEARDGDDGPHRLRALSSASRCWACCRWSTWQSFRPQPKPESTLPPVPPASPNAIKPVSVWKALRSFKRRLQLLHNQYGRETLPRRSALGYFVECTIGAEDPLCISAITRCGNRVESATTCTKGAASLPALGSRTE